MSECGLATTLRLVESDRIVLHRNLSNALVSTSPFPYLPFLVRDLGASEAEVAVHVGFIASARCAGNLLSSYAWGVAADRYGRRPVILLCTALQAPCCLWFAWASSHSLASAALARMAAGGDDQLKEQVQKLLAKAKDLGLDS